MALDWDDVNKETFCRMVEMYLHKITIGSEEAARVVFEANRIRKASLPEELPKALKEFMAWQLNAGVKPAWVNHPIGPGVA